MKYYVYSLIDPRNKTPYYIGKGKNKRYKAHFRESYLKRCKNRNKVEKIKNIRNQGYSPHQHTKILLDKVSEEKALELETFIIEEIGLENLTNLIKVDKVKSGKRNPFYGKNHTEETKARLSETKSGQNHPFWNKELSEKHKENIRKGLEEYERTEKHNQNISEGLKGRSLSEEHKRKIGKGTKGRTHSKKTREKLSKANRKAHLGKTLSEDHKNSLSKAFRGEKNPECKLTRQEAAEIKWISRNTEKTNKEVGKLYSVSDGTASQIKVGNNWKHIEPQKPINYE